MAANGETVQAVAVVQLALLPNGDIKSNLQGGNPLVLLGMLDVARQQVLESMKKPASAISVAPPGLAAKLGLN